MSVETKISEDGSVMFIIISGKFDFAMLNSFRLAYSDDTTKSLDAIVDLRDTTVIDSSGLGMLLNMKRFMNKADGDIEIINCNQDILKVFEITHFNKKFKIQQIK